MNRHKYHYSESKKKKDFRGGREKAQNLKPNFLLVVRLSNQNLINKIKVFQKHLCDLHPELKWGILGTSSLILKVFPMRLESHQDLQKALNALLTFECSRLDKILKFRGVGQSNKHKKVWIGIDSNSTLDSLYRHFDQILGPQMDQNKFLPSVPIYKFHHKVHRTKKKTKQKEKSKSHKAIRNCIKNRAGTYVPVRRKVENLKNPGDQDFDPRPSNLCTLSYTEYSNAMFGSMPIDRIELISRGRDRMPRCFGVLIFEGSRTRVEILESRCEEFVKDEREYFEAWERRVLYYGVLVVDWDRKGSFI